MSTPAYNEGERRKADAHAVMEARRQTYIRRGRRVLLEKMLAGDGTATADDVSAAVELPADLDPRLLGAVPGRLAYDRVIRPAGFIRSARPETHGRWIQRWELADRSAGEESLRDHSDLPEPADDETGGERQGLLFENEQTAAPADATAGAAK